LRPPPFFSERTLLCFDDIFSTRNSGIPKGNGPGVLDGLNRAHGFRQKKCSKHLSGKIAKEIPLKTGQSVHMQFRIARKTPAGTYLVACLGDHLVQELDADGMLIRTIKTPGDPFMAERLSNGNTLVACGDGHRLVEIDPQDRVVWELGENDLPGNPLRFVAGFQQLPNGNLLLCNWPCHGFEGQQPLVVEVARDKRVVWQWTSPNLRGVSSLALLPPASK